MTPKIMMPAAVLTALNKFTGSVAGTSSKAKSFEILNVFEKPTPRGLNKVVENIKKEQEQMEGYMGEENPEDYVSADGNNLADSRRRNF